MMIIINEIVWIVRHFFAIAIALFLDLFADLIIFFAINLFILTMIYMNI